MVSAVPVRRKIPLWKLVGGGAVHCLVPAYLLALGVDGWRFAAAGAGGLAAWLAHVPGMSGWFLGAYAVLGAGATGVAALVRPGGAGAVATPADGAEALRMALAQGRGAFGPQADVALDRIAALRLDPADEGAAPMLRDLAAMVAAGRQALGAGQGGGPGRDAAGDQAMRAMTTQAIERIAGELTRHAGQQAEQARDRALVMATYVGQRYGQDEI
jgi:hypothetical protein